MAADDLDKRLAGLSPAQRELLLARLRARHPAGGEPASQAAGAAAAEEAVIRVSREAPLALSFGQRQLWLLEHLAPGEPLYNIAACVEIDEAARDEGAGGPAAEPAPENGLCRGLRVPVMAAAVRAVLERHEALRTRIAGEVGAPRQEVLEPPAVTLPRVELAALPPARREVEAARLRAAEAVRPFDLGRGPLLRATLIGAGGGRHLLLLTLHHIASDGWSIPILMHELCELYAAGVAGRPAGLGPLPVQYADFAAFQLRRLSGERLAALLSYWKGRLAALPPPLPLPLDRPRPATRSARGEQLGAALDQRLEGAAARLAEAHGATPFMLYLAAFAACLWRYGGQDDVVLGAPVANRLRPEVEGLIGYFVNTLVLRLDLGGDPSFDRLLAGVRETVLGAFNHQELPFELLVDELKPERDLALTPLFQVAFSLQEAPPADPALPGLRVRPLASATGTAKFDLMLTVARGRRGRERPELVAEHAVAIFDRTTVARLLGHYEVLLGAAVAAPEARISALALLTPAERQQLAVEWSDGGTSETLGSFVGLPGGPGGAALAGRGSGTTLDELVAHQAARTPEALAVVGARSSRGRLTYRELDRRANQLAHLLRRRGVGPEVPVGIFLERTAEMVVAVLGVLKAGGAYVPLDPAYPAERVAFTLADCGAPVVVSQTELVARLPAGSEAVLLDGAGAELEGCSGEAPPPSLAAPGNLAYLIYTSGSTGRPKGVAVTHASVAALLRWAEGVWSNAELAEVAASTSLCFDLSVYELFVPLSRGGRVLLLGSALDLIAEGGARPTLLNTVPSAASALVRAGALPASLLTLNLAGEPIPGALVEELERSGPGRVLNLYGPSETTVYSTIQRVQPVHQVRRAQRVAPAEPGHAADAAGAGGPPIGRPILGTEVLVLDPRGVPLPIGVPGELWIGGEGLARGYFRRPERTAASFLPHPLPDGEPGRRLYRTGDRARLLADGRIEFLERLDRQVKLRGFRIEPGEVEAALAGDAEVRACAVLVREGLAGPPGTPEGAGLVAFVVAAEGALENQAGGGFAPRVRGRLAGRLPGFLVPSLLIPLAELPLTANGKLDRSVLARLPLVPPASGGEADAGARRRQDQAHGEVEEEIAAAWREALGRPEVGTGESFFEVGGNSLLLIQVHARLRRRFPRLDILDLFRFPSIASLAGRLESGGGEAGGLEGRARVPPPAQPAEEALAPPAAVAPRQHSGGGEVAVVGMAGRFPGAPDVETFWRNLIAGVESVVRLGRADLDAAGVTAEARATPGYVAAAATIDGVDQFDAGFFGLTPREAEATDPQHRLLLECAWDALENAGYDPAAWPGRIGLYAGMGMNTYYQHLEASVTAAGLGPMQGSVGLDRDFLATRISYRLGLEGPSLTVQTACSTSLVAVHLACQALLDGECDLALAGAVSLRNLYREGYLFEEGGIVSPDGHCRAFDAAAAGTVPSDGLGLVALRRLSDAREDGDSILAVIKGTAINNDGSAKIGYTAPGFAGQVRVVREALAVAGVDPATISYVETHGTGTSLGDPIEISALAEVFGREAPDRPETPAGAALPAGPAQRVQPAAGQRRVALGSVKTNIGHLDCAAGIAGLIKTILALQRGAIPPSLHFERPNPRIKFEGTPFFVAASKIEPWPGVDGLRRAGVSSFGIGGTNAHVVLEEAPPEDPPEASVRATAAAGQGEPAAAPPLPHASPDAGAATAWHLLQLSARTGAALDLAAGRLAVHLAQHPELEGAGLSNVAHTLRVGRRAFEHRLAVLCRGREEARANLAGEAPEGGLRRVRGQAAGRLPLAFLFPGQGAQRVGMGEGLYRGHPLFRAELDRAAELLQPHLGRDLRELLFPRHGREEAARRLDRTRYAQPALFAVEHALAQLWMSWGLRPEATLGHSIGEYVAACLAGVFTLEDALALVALRGRLVDELPEGAMLSVPLPASQVEPLLGDGLCLAAENASDRTVVAGAAPAVAALAERLAARGLSCRRLRTSHAFHSPALVPAVAPLVAAVAAVPRFPPAIPFVSNLTGTWIRPEEAMDPAYWGQQLLRPVRFAAGLRTLAESHAGALLEVGPGETLGRLARRELRSFQAEQRAGSGGAAARAVVAGAAPGGTGRTIVSSLPEPSAAADGPMAAGEPPPALGTAGRGPSGTQEPMGPMGEVAGQRVLGWPSAGAGGFGERVEARANGMPVGSEGPGGRVLPEGVEVGATPADMARLAPWEDTDSEHLLRAVARLWVAGAALDGHALSGPGQSRRVALPGYPFERRRFWLPRPPRESPPPAQAAPASPHAALPALPGDGGRQPEAEVDGRRLDPADWFYLPSWRRSLPPPLVGAVESTAGVEVPAFEAAQTAGLPQGPYLLFGEISPATGGPAEAPTGMVRMAAAAGNGGLEGVGRETLTAALTRRLLAAGREVITVLPGAGFARPAEDLFLVRPGEPEDYDSLWGALAASGRSCSTVLHVWSAWTAWSARSAQGGAEGEEPPASEATLEAELDRGFYSLVALASAAGRAGRAGGAGGEEGGGERSVDLWVVSRGVHDVAGGEPLAPERATVLGPCRVIPLEFPHISCRNLDLPWAENAAVASGAGDARPVHGGASRSVRRALRAARAPDAEADLVLAEVAARPDEKVLAYRGGQRWVQDFEPVRLPGDLPAPPAVRGAPAPTRPGSVPQAARGGAPQVKPGGVYLITGGLGGIGHALARRLAAEGARLVLIGRSELIPQDERQGDAGQVSGATASGARAGGWSAEKDLAAADAPGVASPAGFGGLGGLTDPSGPQGPHTPAGSLGASFPAEIPGAAAGTVSGAPMPASRRRQRLRELQEAGAEVLWAAADVCDRVALERVRDAARQRFGGVDGVIHAAGVPGGGILQITRRSELAAVLAPKVQGTLALAEVFPPEELDFFVLCSSLNSVLGAFGQTSYCAANAFLDAFAAAHPGHVLSIAWDRWTEVGMAAEAAAQPLASAPRRLPPPAAEGGTPVAHPLLDLRLAPADGRETFLTRFSSSRHWVLAEHRLDGLSVLPGTAYLELARAALAAVRHGPDGSPVAIPAGAPPGGEAEAGGSPAAGGAAGPVPGRAGEEDQQPGLRRGDRGERGERVLGREPGGEPGSPAGQGVEIRYATFVAPLLVPEGEEREVLTSLRRVGGSGDSWEFRIASRAPEAPGGWQEHAMGELSPAGSPPGWPDGQQVPALAGLLAALPPSPVPEGMSHGVTETPQPVTLSLGPHWGSLRALAIGDPERGGEFLALLELPGAFGGEVASLPLHPALLDVATGFARSVDPAGALYLPFSYSGLRLARPLPSRVYSYQRRLTPPPAQPAEPSGSIAKAEKAERAERVERVERGRPEVISYAVAIYDISGELLLTIDQYSFRRADELSSQAEARQAGPLPDEARFPAASAAAGSAPAATSAPPPAAASAAAPPLPAAVSTSAALPAPGESEVAGLSTVEGVDAFWRVLGRVRLPQVLVSVRDLRALVAEAATWGGEQLLAQLAALHPSQAAEHHPRPGLAVDYAAPRDPTEQHLAEVWQDLLGIAPVGIHDDFFELGGDSVLGLRIAALARDRGLLLSPNDLFAHPTIAQLAPRLQPAPSGAPSLPTALPSPSTPAASPTAPLPGEAPISASAPPSYAPIDFPNADLSAHDLDTLLAELGELGDS